MKKAETKKPETLQDTLKSKTKDELVNIALAADESIKKLQLELTKANQAILKMAKS